MHFLMKFFTQKTMSGLDVTWCSPAMVNDLISNKVPCLELAPEDISGDITSGVLVLSGSCWSEVHQRIPLIRQHHQHLTVWLRGGLAWGRVVVAQHGVYSGTAARCWSTHISHPKQNTTRENCRIVRQALQNITMSAPATWTQILDFLLHPASYRVLTACISQTWSLSHVSWGHTILCPHVLPLLRQRPGAAFKQHSSTCTVRLWTEGGDQPSPHFSPQ